MELPNSQNVLDRLVTQAHITVKNIFRRLYVPPAPAPDSVRSSLRDRHHRVLGPALAVVLRTASAARKRAAARQCQPGRYFGSRRRPPARQGSKPGGSHILSGPDRALQLDLVHRFLHRLEGPLEHGLLLGSELDLVDLLDPAGADGDGHAHVVAPHAVLSVEEGCAREDALLVAQVTLGH